MTNTRRGAMLLEAAVAGGLLAVLLIVWLRVASLAAVERRAVEKRVIALQEAAGALEQARALPWDQITPERLAEIRLSPAADKILPAVALAWTVEPSSSGPAAKHIRLDIAWRGPTVAPAAPVRLNYWVFAPRGTSPGGSP